MLRALFLTLAVLFSPLAFTQEMPEIKLTDIRILQSEIDPNHLTAFGRDQTTGNIAVIDMKDGKATNPILQRSSFSWNDKGVDFPYETGEWLVLTPERTFEGATRVRALNGLIRPLTGMEPMKELEVSSALIEEKGFASYIDPTSLDQIKKGEDQKPYEYPSASLYQPLLLTIDYKTVDREKLFKGLTDKILAKFEGQVIYADDVGYYGEDTRTFVVAVFENHAKEVAAYMKRVTKHEAKAQYGLFSSDPIWTNEKGSPRGWSVFNQAQQRVSEIGKMNLSGASAELREEIRVELQTILRQVEYMIGVLMARPYHQLGLWQHSDSARAKFRDKYLSTADSLFNRLILALDSLETEAARETLIFEPHDYTPSALILDRQVSGMEINYFQYWLNHLLEDVKWLRSATPEQLKDARRSGSSGGLLSSFAFMSVNMTHYSPAQTAPPYIDLEGHKHWPLKLFGHKDSVEARRALIQFIISGDKESEYLRQWTLENGDSYAREYAKGVYGDRVVLRLIQDLQWAGNRTHRDDYTFSRALYYKQVMQVITELLNTSTITISNSAVYMTLLDASFGIQQLLSEDPYLKNQLNFNRELTRELLALKDATQLRLARGLFMNAPDAMGVDTEECMSAVLPH